MTVIDLINKLLHLPPNATVMVATGLYDKAVGCEQVLEYDHDYNDVWLVGGHEASDE